MNEEIKRLLLEDGQSISSIATSLGIKSVDVRSQIKAMGLDWAIGQNRKLSKGHAALTSLFKELFPNYEIVNEFYIGERLHLDIYCPRLQIAAEYHGIQHFEFNKHFHKTKTDFIRGQENDLLKAKKCLEMGISLITLCYNDDLSLSAVTDKIIEAVNLQETKVEEKKSSRYKTEYYEKAKLERNARNRELYKKMKQGKKK